MAACSGPSSATLSGTYTLTMTPGSGCLSSVVGIDGPRGATVTQNGSSLAVTITPPAGVFDSRYDIAGSVSGSTVTFSRFSLSESGRFTRTVEGRAVGSLTADGIQGTIDGRMTGQLEAFFPLGIVPVSCETSDHTWRLTRTS